MCWDFSIVFSRSFLDKKSINENKEYIFFLFFSFFCEWVLIFNESLFILFHEWACSFCFNDKSMLMMWKTLSDFLNTLRSDESLSILRKIVFRDYFCSLNWYIAIILSTFNSLYLVTWFICVNDCLHWDWDLSWFYVLFVYLFNRDVDSFK